MGMSVFDVRTLVVPRVPLGCHVVGACKLPCACVPSRDSLQLTSVQNATAAYVQQLIDTLAVRGKYLWQALARCGKGQACLPLFVSCHFVRHLRTTWSAVAIVIALSPQHPTPGVHPSNPGTGPTPFKHAVFRLQPRCVWGRMIDVVCGVHQLIVTYLRAYASSRGTGQLHVLHDSSVRSLVAAGTHVHAGS